MIAAIDPWIFAFSLVTVAVTLAMGYWAAGKSRTASDFFVAGRGVSVGWNASAISGEYLSAASFMGVAGTVMATGYDALWYPVCYACGYLFLLLFIAGPLRRFGAYTIPDFAEGRFDSPMFRKIAVIFVLFIGFFYTMPQMKGAGTTLAYVFKDLNLFGAIGLPYWVGVVLVGAVITLNVAIGGMKGITLVQAFQYWLKMFAIATPVFVLMALHGGYGSHLGRNGNSAVDARIIAPGAGVPIQAPAGFAALDPSLLSNVTNWLRPEGYTVVTNSVSAPEYQRLSSTVRPGMSAVERANAHWNALSGRFPGRAGLGGTVLGSANSCAVYAGLPVWIHSSVTNTPISNTELSANSPRAMMDKLAVEFGRAGVAIVPDGADRLFLVPNFVAPHLRAILTPVPGDRAPLPATAPDDASWLNPFGRLSSKAAKAAGLTGEQARPYALLYTYSLIIALVCGTAGLPHILVRFYTNPDGVAAKRTTMWVMILIGVFYLFPPMFGAMGRNLMPALYDGVGAKGTDKVVLELPRVVPGVWGSILSGITCAGAFAAFMSTFSGLLVSMTGALAHDVYGRIIRPSSSPAERMRMFKWCAFAVGGAATLLGCFVERLEINFMVGQAFAIAAASYFPLLFMSVWWRGMTMKGAAVGMLAGGACALGAVVLTNLSDLKKLDLAAFWAAHPLLRILCEQPAIWCVPMAILLMVIVSRLTRSEVPSDIRMKMLVLHAPEALGLKQEYIRDHEGH